MHRALPLFVLGLVAGSTTSLVHAQLQPQCFLWNPPESSGARPSEKLVPIVRLQMNDTTTASSAAASVYSMIQAFEANEWVIEDDRPISIMLQNAKLTAYHPPSGVL